MIDETEDVRARWRRARHAVRLADTDDGEFGTGGLARLLERPAVRLLVLPADPERDLVEFDEAFWAWFRTDLEDPVTGQPSHWGSGERPTSSAAVRADERRELAGRFVAILRNGGLEIGLGREAAYTIRSEVEAFRLLTIVGRVWCALHQYRFVIERFKVAGPWQVALAIIATDGRVLGNVATGYGEPFELGEAKPCPDKHLLHVIEFAEWPDPNGVQALAFRLGAWIEDAWGYKTRRFIARGGPAAGGFDRTKYGWW